MGRFGPDLAIVAETSLMSLLRWSYKTGMEKSTSSSNGQVTLVIFFLLALLTLLLEGSVVGFQI
jgi:syntaxin-binding protein 5